MSENEDKESKTEDPSQKKLEDALEKGQVVNSKEVNNFLTLTFLTLLIVFAFPTILNSCAKTLQFFIANAGLINIDQGIVGIILPKTLFKFLIYLSPLFIITIIVAIFSSYIQHGEFIFTGEQLQPQLSRISIISGLKRLFSTKSLVEFIKSFFKILLVGTILYLVIIGDIKELRQYQNLALSGILNQLRIMVNHILVSVCVIMAVIALLDFLYQRFEHFNNLKMSKHEQKEEYKQMEGSPEVKQKLRQLRRENLQKNLKQTVPKSTVIITNPEHYAIALQYEHANMSAPIVIAKGLDLIAQTIKKLAEENKIPIVENPPLARALYKQVKINEEIPIEHYEAVAKIITYVMSLKNKRTKN